MDAEAPATSRSRRPLRAHALAAVVIVGALASGIAAMYVMVLAFYPACVGEASEAAQYSGRAVNEDWQCPFRDVRHSA